jgi:hypothetical protein
MIIIDTTADQPDHATLTAIMEMALRKSADESRLILRRAACGISSDMARYRALHAQIATLERALAGIPAAVASVSQMSFLGSLAAEGAS